MTNNSSHYNISSGTAVAEKIIGMSVRENREIKFESFRKFLWYRVSKYSSGLEDIMPLIDTHTREEIPRHTNLTRPVRFRTYR